mmetsp:Transcript_42910/g.91244  ORF Transcript_42910/g.91244 Transcript_42910/m.91244 type:complete len:111 (-) Transcript_42910:588-920(-)
MAEGHHLSTREYPQSSLGTILLAGSSDPLEDKVMQGRQLAEALEQSLSCFVPVNQMVLELAMGLDERLALKCWDVSWAHGLWEEAWLRRRRLIKRPRHRSRQNYYLDLRQ